MDFHRTVLEAHTAEQDTEACAEKRQTKTVTSKSSPLTPEARC